MKQNANNKNNIINALSLVWFLKTNKVFCSYKKGLLLLFLLTKPLFAQETLLKKFEISAQEITCSVIGVDQITIENSEDNFMSIELNDEKENNHDIVVKEENEQLIISFLPIYQFKDEVFRKFVTKRSNRATATLKIPKNKQLTFLGKEIDITLKNYIGSLAIYIDKGALKLHKIVGKTDVQLYSGNVYATVKKSSIAISSNQGNIFVNGKHYLKSYQKIKENAIEIFKVNTIKGNIYLEE